MAIRLNEDKELVAQIREGLRRRPQDAPLRGDNWRQWARGGLSPF